MKQKINFLIIVLACLVSLPVKAKDDVQLMRLQAEMLRLISTNDKEQFTKVTEDLKNLCHQHGNERLFYTAWGNQSIYEATHQNYLAATG